MLTAHEFFLKSVKTFRLFSKIAPDRQRLMFGIP